MDMSVNDTTTSVVIYEGVPALTAEYLESLSRSDLLSLARYVRDMGQSLEGMTDASSSHARERAKNSLSAIFQVSDSRLPVSSPLDGMILDELNDITSWGVDNFPYPNPDEAISFLLGARDIEGHPTESFLDKQAFVFEKLKAGPMLWGTIEKELLQVLEQREEDAGLVDLYFDLVRWELIETSTHDADGPTQTWASVVKLGSWAETEFFATDEVASDASR